MNHLTEDQLGALADGMLEGGPRAAAERHLEACAACRESLAGLLALDRDLRGALAHEPGEEYFETFAARVGGRIRAAGLRGAQARAGEGRGLADWFRSPRKLAALGAVATVVVVAGVVMLSQREVTMPVLRQAEPRLAAEAVAPPAVEAPEPTGVPLQETPAADAVTTAPPVAERELTPPPPAPEAKSLARVRDRERAVATADERLATGAPAAQAERSEGMRYKPEAGGERLAPPAPMKTTVAGDGATATVTEEPQAEGPAATANEAAPAKGAAAPLLQRARQTLGAAKSDAAATEDVFAGQPTFTDVHGRNALRLTRLAETMRVAPAWDSAAGEWAMVLLGTQGTSLEAETRWQLARARWRAWRAGASERRAERAAEAFAGFLGMAPGGARRDSVETWSRTLGK